VPLWVITKMMADECNMSPWQFEKECTEEWYHRLRGWLKADGK